MGAAFGPFIFGFLAETIGRKITLTLMALPFLGAFAIAAFAQTIPLYYVAKILMGVGIGGAVCVLPIFIVETVEDGHRELLLSSRASFLIAESLLFFSVGPFVTIMVFNLILASICILYAPIFWYTATETPYRLVAVNKEQQALEALRYLRRKPSKVLERELDAIKSHLKDLKSGSVVDLFRSKGARNAFFYSIALTTFQQLSGINVISLYGQKIFAETTSDIPPEDCAIIVVSAQLLVSCLSLPFVDRVGRKILLLVGVTGAIVAEVVMGTYFYLENNGGDVSGLGWLPVVTLVVFIIFYDLEIGAIPWSIMGEILPLNVMLKTSLIVTSLYWLGAFFLARYFSLLANVIGMAGGFWLFAGFCVLFDLFAYFFVFKTKGKSLKKIQTILNK